MFIDDTRNTKKRLGELSPGEMFVLDGGVFLIGSYVVTCGYNETYYIDLSTGSMSKTGMYFSENTLVEPVEGDLTIRNHS